LYVPDDSYVTEDSYVSERGKKVTVRVKVSDYVLEEERAA